MEVACFWSMFLKVLGCFRSFQGLWCLEYFDVLDGGRWRFRGLQLVVFGGWRLWVWGVVGWIFGFGGTV